MEKEARERESAANAANKKARPTEMVAPKKEEPKSYKTEGKTTIQLIQERQRRMKYEEEKATGAPVPATFEEWDALG